MTDLVVERVDDLVRTLERAPADSRVVLAKGRYELAEPLAVRSSVSLVGTPGQTFLVGAGAEPLITTERGAETLALHDLILEGGHGVRGGALAATGLKTLTIEGCRFVGNRADRAGGALYLRDVGDASITRCVFIDNQSAKIGGAIDVESGSNVLVDRSVFFHNTSEVGGAAGLNAGGALRLRHCTFVDNEATWPSGGGALFVLGTRIDGASGHVANCVFRGREAIGADPSQEYEVFVTHSIVPADLFEQPRFESVAGNTLGVPQLELVSPALFRLVAGAPGVGTADLKYVETADVDLLGRLLIQRGAADPGALAR